jgi:hypothetical protein
VTLGAALREARGSMTQDDLAAAIEPDRRRAKTLQSVISDLENDARKLVPRYLETIATIEDALGLARGYVLARAGYVDPAAVEVAIAGDPALDADARSQLMEAYWVARDQSHATRPRRRSARPRT